MNNGEEYLGKVLQSCRDDVEQRLSDEGRGTLASLMNKLNENGNSGSILKQLYRIRDLEQFALSCLWIADRAERSPATPAEMELDRKMVGGAIIEYFARQDGIEQTAVAPQRPVPPVFLKYYESFDTLVLQVKDSTDDPDLYEQMFDHLQEYCADKLQELDALDEPGVSIFMNALIDFLQYVISRGLRNDSRVVALLGATTKDLSEVVGSGFDFNISALEKATTRLSDAKFSIK